ncbi:signal peptidase II [Bacteroidota bacterium]
MVNKKNIICYFIFSFFLILLDQLTKLSVKGFSILGLTHEGMNLGESIQFIGDFLQITYVENAGMAFGISFGSGKLFLSLFRIIASILIIYYLFNLSGFSKYVKFGVSVILAGAVGNLIDSLFYGLFYGEAPLFYGRVVDFIQIDIPDIDFMGIFYTHWPVFNIADACVTIGVIILLIFNKHIPSFREVFGKGRVSESED